MYRTIKIRELERGLWFLNGTLHRVLEPGRHRIPSWPLMGDEHDVEAVSTLDTEFVHPLISVLAKDEDMAELLEIVELSSNERALVWIDGVFETILGPGRHAYWKIHRDVKIERHTLDEFWFRHPQLDSILSHTSSMQHLVRVEVKPDAQSFLVRDGDVFEELTSGRHVYWKGNGLTYQISVDRREQSLDVSGQEIMTSDKVTLRVNLYVTYRVVDGLKAIRNVQDHSDTIYREAQLALRAAVGRRQLDDLLAEKEVLAPEIRSALERRAADFGVEIISVGLRDVILPGEMKTILNQVIEAEKQAQANLIRRREETAAARSEANTAKLLAANPILVRFRELEMLGQVIAGTKASFVLGSGDLVEQLRSLTTRESG